MALNIEAWAPKLIIAFQLTVWSAVGIMLLQRGAISLCNKTEQRMHVEQLQISVGKENELAKESATQFSQGTSADRNKKGESIERDNRQRIASRRKEQSSEDDDVPTKRRRRITTVPESTQADRISQGSMIGKRVTINRVGSIRDKPTTDNNADASESGIFQDRKSFSECDDKDPVPHRIEEMKRNKNGTESQRPPVNQIGTAAAIVMLAIGVVMLLLGPLIVVLRAIANRRRTRVMLIKTRCRNDQPPSYEEATLMDQVPRYSSLQLDAMPESSVSL